MAAVVGSERTEMERFGSGGMALLPWTKQMLTVLFERMRLLLRIIYYSFLSIFQMFRFEVHVRITDETGQHIQHMTTATNTTESFLFSSLFDGDSGVIVGGSNPLSNFCADVGDPFAGKSTAEALLSTLRADDLCCGLVDDFVSRTSSSEDSFFLGHQSGWKIFVSSSDSSTSSDSCHQSNEKIFKRDTVKKKVIKQDIPEEEKSFQWSSEEDQNVVEFDSEESKALWESLSKSSDPYNPFFFSACITTNTDMGKNNSEVVDGRDSDLMSVSTPAEETFAPRGLNFWISRSDSESSWGSSDSSSPDIDKEESERLWDFFSSPEDPYNPMCFTACTVGSSGPTATKQQTSLPAPPSKSDTDPEEESSFPPSSEDDEEDQLWKSLCQKDDPYHPLNFQPCLHSSPTSLQPEEKPTVATPRKLQAVNLRLQEQQIKHHSHPEKTFVPWKRPGQTAQSPTGQKKQSKTSLPQKKVQFSPVVQVHVMRTWLFARQQCRKGPWEEMVRDRARFQRRIQETEKAIGYCLTPSHREKIRASLEDGALN